MNKNILFLFFLVCSVYSLGQNSAYITFDSLTINYGKPIGNGIITALNKKQAYERCGIKRSNKPNKGLLIPQGIWREMDNFSSGAICMVLASENYEESDYFRDYSEFQKSKIN